MAVSWTYNISILISIVVAVYLSFLSFDRYQHSLSSNAILTQEDTQQQQTARQMDTLRHISQEVDHTKHRYFVVLTKYRGVWTGDEKNPRACGFAVDLQQERFHRVFSSKNYDCVESVKTFVEDHQDETYFVDLSSNSAAGLITPGFIENHAHILLSGHFFNGVQLRDAKSRLEFRQTLQEFIDTQRSRTEEPLQDGEWITGGSWNDKHAGYNGELPLRFWIDDITQKNPAFLWRMDAHAALCNSLCLQLANITKDTPDPEGGVIVRDAEGNPTGLLRDLAMSLVQPLTPHPYNRKALYTGQSHALKHGITTMMDAGAGPTAEKGDSWKQLEVFLKAKNDGKLKVRVVAAQELATWQRLADYVKANGTGDDWVRVGLLKDFIDGSFGSSTALMFEPYNNDGSGIADNRGLQVKSTEQMIKEVSAAEHHGFQVAVHAIGEKAVATMVDVYEAAIKSSPHGPDRDRRFRIEHAQLIRTEEIIRMRDLGIVASMQPSHLLDDAEYAEATLGKDSPSIRNLFRIKSMKEAGVQIAFGSDWFVADLCPMLGTFAAVSRSTLSFQDGFLPEESISVEDSLRFYTVEGAKALFLEDRIGQIKEGYLADFAVLNRSPFDVHPTEIKDIRTSLTVVAGRVMYTR